MTTTFASRSIVRRRPLTGSMAGDSDKSLRVRRRGIDVDHELPSPARFEEVHVGNLLAAQIEPCTALRIDDLPLFDTKGSLHRQTGSFERTLDLIGRVSRCGGFSRRDSDRLLDRERGWRQLVRTTRDENREQEPRSSNRDHPERDPDGSAGHDRIVGGSGTRLLQSERGSACSVARGTRSRRRTRHRCNSRGDRLVCDLRIRHIRHSSDGDRRPGVRDCVRMDRDPSRGSVDETTTSSLTSAVDDLVRVALARNQIEAEIMVATLTPERSILRLA